MWSPSLSVRAAQAILPPSAPSRSAIAWPMPRLDPVTSTTLPSSLPMRSLLRLRPAHGLRARKSATVSLKPSGLLEVDRVAAARELAQLGAGDRLVQLADRGRRRQRVVAADDQQRRDREARQVAVGCRPSRHCARVRGGVGRVEARDLAVEERVRRLALLELLTERAHDQRPLRQSDRGALLLQPLVELRPVNRGRGVGEHERAHALRVTHGVAERAAAAHRLRDERRALDAELVEQRLEVVDEARGALALRVAGSAEAALVDRDATEALAEGGELLPPGDVVAGGAVEEDEAGPLALLLVEQLDPVELGERHAHPTPVRGGGG